MIKYRILSAFVLVFIILFFVVCPPVRLPVRVSYTELGVPTSDRFETGVRARSPWDMMIWDGFLYVGSGDYDVNAGPIDVERMNLRTGEWENSGTLPEEEINRFRVVDGKLAVPGIDPQENWDFGNYYVLSDGEWVQNRVLPDGVHTFDVVSYNGMIFAGLGVEEGEYPIVMSDDGGATFRHVEMWKDGERLDTTGRVWVRVYNLFTLQGNLYAFFVFRSREATTMDLYRYTNERFEYDTTWLDNTLKVAKIKFKSFAYSPIPAITEYKNKLFFTTGNLYVTDDAKTLTEIPFPDSETVYDLVSHNGKLYVLCGAPQEDGCVRVSVWANSKKNDSSFTELFYFDYPIPPLSLAVKNNIFYIGMSDTTAENDLNGTILQVKYD